MLRRLAVVATALAGIPLGIAWIVSENVLHPRPRKEDHTLSEYGLHAEEISFLSRDGTPLVGWFVPARGSSQAPGVVLSHGWARSHAELAAHADILHRAGYAIFAFDYRHRGQSGGDAITFGLREQEDLIGALDVIATRPEVDRDRIGVLGMSTGAVIAILVALRDQRIRALVLECPYRSPEAVLARAMNHYGHIPGIFAPLAKIVIELRIGQSLDSVQAERAIGKLGPRSVFVIADERDALVGSDETVRVFEAANDPRRFWMIEGADHARGWQTAPQDYEERIVRFFREELAEAPLSQESAAQ